MITILLLAVLIAVLIGMNSRFDRIRYLSNDDNFKDGAVWPDWLVKDCEKWNRKNPNKQVAIRK